uniref:DNA polymerase catalytic subunit n=1 Tax=Tupaiid herpesvirus 1 (strain 1) TaxID=10397 RepID=DPOL_TUHV1|nr:RecName: Full=DNA polymerase catalytic subunit [Tupaiid betaherpesvirus 1]AAD08666.1 DNA polymerase [Tupaiid betaherpesvirus 1]
MSTVTFFNPYLCGPRKPRAPSAGEGGAEGAAAARARAASAPFLQIVPRGCLYDGERGLLKHNCALAPRMFFRDRPYVLSKDLVWPTLPPPAVPASTTERAPRAPAPSADLLFHMYDQAETVVSADSKELIHPGYRHRITPCGVVLRLFGRTADGASLCVNVFGQDAYFYCRYGDAQSLHDRLYRLSDTLELAPVFHVRVRRVQRCSIYGYGTRPFADLYLVACGNWHVLKKMGQCLLDEGVEVFEVGVSPLTRFLLDKKIPSFGWCRLRRWHARPAHGRLSTAELEVDCEVADVRGVDDVAWPLYRCLSFDIECLSGGGAFPVAENLDDVVIQISCVCYPVGGTEEQRAAFPVAERHLFTLGPCAPIPGVLVYEFPSEFELLCGFFTFFGRYAPEFVTGYNINNFDWRYLLTRAERVYRWPVAEYTRLRFGGRFCAYVPGGGGRQPGFRTAQTKVLITGTVVLDLYPVCMAKVSAPDYKLNTVCELYLGRQKEDLSYKELPRAFLSGDAGRARVGRYCVQDAVLVKELFEKLNYHYEAAAVARLARISLRKVIFEGQQIRIYTCLLEEAAARQMVVPTFRSGAQRGAATGAGGGGGEETTYQGATVFEPTVGYHHAPVAVFDFASLYPSIIMAHNLCYSTWLRDDPGTPARPPETPARPPETPAAGPSGAAHAGGVPGATFRTPFRTPAGVPAAAAGGVGAGPPGGGAVSSASVGGRAAVSPSETPAEREPEPAPEDVFVVHVGQGVSYRFVRENVRASILSELLRRWLAQRRAVREAMRECEDETRRLLLDKEQLALKVTCNAFYGFTGFSQGMLPCLPVAASITTIGRDMLSRTSAYIEAHFAEPAFLARFFEPGDLPRADEPPPTVRVIYGDTDSVFVRFGGVRAGAIVARGEDLAAAVTEALFTEPVKLEFEKLFVALMMICKKRYIGRVFGSDALVMKGVDLVRKTACRFVKTVVRDVVELVFRDAAVAEAATRMSELTLEEMRRVGVPAGFHVLLQRLARARDDLFSGRVETAALVLSSVLSQDVSRYKQLNLPHLAVIRRLAARSEELPSVGDRVSYVLTAGPPDGRANAPNYELAEDPDYVAAHRVPIHAAKYFEQVVKAVTNTLYPVFPRGVVRRDRFLADLVPKRVYLGDEFKRHARPVEEEVCESERGGSGLLSSLDSSR